MRPPGYGEAPRPNGFDQSDNPAMLVDEDEIDRIRHAEGVNRFTRDDPQSFTRGKPVSRQKAIASRPGCISELHMRGNRLSAGHIPDFYAPDTLSVVRGDKCGEGIGTGHRRDLPKTAFNGVSISFPVTTLVRAPAE